MKKKENNPFDWDSITIEKYYGIKDILDDESTDYLTKNVQLVSLILDVDEDEVWNMDLSIVGDYIDKLQFLNRFELPKSPNLKIKLPSYNLLVMKDLSKINMSQYVDFQNFASLPLRESMDKILSIFLIPEGKTYNTDYDILDLQREIRDNISFRTAEGLFNFFLMEFSGLLIRSLNSYRKMMKKEKDQRKREEMSRKMEEIKESLTSLTGLFSSRGSVTAQN